MKLHEFWEGVEKRLEQYPHWRRGQAAFNYLAEVKPGLSDDILGTSSDPFYMSNDKLYSSNEWLDFCSFLERNLT